MPDKDSKTEETAAPVDLEALAEDVRSRLHAHGQHGALASFGKYHAEVLERLKEGARLVAHLDIAPVPTSARSKPTKTAAKKAMASK